MASSKTAAPAEPAKEIATQVFSREDLTNITSVEQALAMLKDAGISIITDVPDIGDGFMEVDKAALLDIPFLFLQWEFLESDLEQEGGDGFYVGVRAMIPSTNGEPDRKVFFSDGSGIGIYTQLKKATETTGQTGGLYAPRGLASFTTKKSTKPTYYIQGRKLD